MVSSKEIISQGKLTHAESADFWGKASKAWAAAFAGEWVRAYPLLLELAPQKPNYVSLRRWLAEAQLRLGKRADALESWLLVLRLQEEPAALHRKLFRQSFRERLEELLGQSPPEAQELCRRARREFESDLGPIELAMLRKALGESSAATLQREKRRRLPASPLGKLPPGLSAGRVWDVSHRASRICRLGTDGVAWIAARARPPYVDAGSAWKRSVLGSPRWFGSVGGNLVLVADEKSDEEQDRRQVHVFSWTETGAVLCERSFRGTVWRVAQSGDRSRLLVIGDPFDKPYALVLAADGQTICRSQLGGRGWAQVAPASSRGWWVRDWRRIQLLGDDGMPLFEFKPPRIKVPVRRFGPLIHLDVDESGELNAGVGMDTPGIGRVSGLEREFSLLGIEPTADRDIIKKAFRRSAQHVHPDRNPSSDANARMQEVNAAYERLESADLEGLASAPDEAGLVWAAADDVVTSFAADSSVSWAMIFCRSGKCYRVADHDSSMAVELPGAAVGLALDGSTGIALVVVSNQFWLVHSDGGATVVRCDLPSGTGTSKAWSLAGTGAFAVQRELAPSTLIIIDGLKACEKGRVVFPAPVNDIAVAQATTELLVAAGRQIFSVGFSALRRGPSSSQPSWYKRDRPAAVAQVASRVTNESRPSRGR